MKGILTKAVIAREKGGPTAGNT